MPDAFWPVATVESRRCPHHTVTFDAPGKVPSESRFGPSSLGYGHFPVLTPGPPIAPHIGPKRPKTDSNGWRSGRSGVPRCPKCVLCSPNRPRSVMNVDRGPRSALWGRFWPSLSARSAPFLARSGGYPPPAWGRRGAEWGGGLEPKTGIRRGHHWESPTPEFRAGTGAKFWL